MSITGEPLRQPWVSARPTREQAVERLETYLRDRPPYGYAGADADMRTVLDALEAAERERDRLREALLHIRGQHLDSWGKPTEHPICHTCVMAHAALGERE